MCCHSETSIQAGKKNQYDPHGSLAVTAREGENPYAVGQAAGQAAGKQLGRTGLKGLGGHQVDQWQQRPTACWATLGRVLTGG